MIGGTSHVCHLRGHVKSITRSLVHETSLMLALLRRTSRLDLPTSITSLLQVGMFVARWPLSALIEGSVIYVGAVHESQPRSAAPNPRIRSPASVALFQQLSQYRHSPAPLRFGRNAVYYGMGRRFSRLACGLHQSRARDSASLIRCRYWHTSSSISVLVAAPSPSNPGAHIESSVPAPWEVSVTSTLHRRSKRFGQPGIRYPQ